MFYKIIKPSAVLTPFIKDFMLLRFSLDNTQPAFIKPFPANIDPCLVFYVRGTLQAHNLSLNKKTTFARVAINASQISRFDFYLPNDFFLISVNFQPHALSLFLQEPLTEFADKRVDGISVLGQELSSIQEQIENTSTNSQIIGILERYLIKRIGHLKKGFSPLEKLILTMAEGKLQHTVDEWASIACLSVSQFERKFIQLTGVTPKLFCRISRFNKAYSLKETFPHLDWLQVAMDTGYHDYQHLVKDFKQFSCTTPNSLLLQQSKTPDKIFHY